MTIETEAVMAIDDKLSKIKKRAGSLNDKTDQLNVTIKHIEDGLQGAGVAFWWEDGPRFDVRTFDGDDGEERLYAILGYARVGTEWRLAVQDHRELNHPTGWYQAGAEDPIPLARASRAIRLAVAPEIEAFLDAFDQAVERMEQKVDDVISLVDDRSAVDRASGKDMERLRRALSTPGERVELARHFGHPSASAKAASESAHNAAQLNSTGARIARIFNAEGRRFECGVNASQAAELIKAGATEK